MIESILSWLRGLFNHEPAKLAVVRKYRDANGSYVGELYLYQTVKRKHDTVTGYVMIGASLDTLPFDTGEKETDVFALDTGSDFLEPMPPMTLRVGALDPAENDNVRRMIRRLPRRGMTLVVQNRFIERVMRPEER